MKRNDRRYLVLLYTLISFITGCILYISMKDTLSIDTIVMSDNSLLVYLLPFILSISSLVVIPTIFTLIFLFYKGVCTGWSICFFLSINLLNMDLLSVFRYILLPIMILILYSILTKKCYLASKQVLQIYLGKQETTYLKRNMITLFLVSCLLVTLSVLY